VTEIREGTKSLTNCDGISDKILQFE
jgi:hypothetical protein